MLILLIYSAIFLFYFFSLVYLPIYYVNILAVNGQKHSMMLQVEAENTTTRENRNIKEKNQTGSLQIHLPFHILIDYAVFF